MKTYNNNNDNTSSTNKRIFRNIAPIKPLKSNMESLMDHITRKERHNWAFLTKRERMHDTIVSREKEELSAYIEELREPANKERFARVKNLGAKNGGYYVGLDTPKYFATFQECKIAAKLEGITHLRMGAVVAKL